MIGCIPLVEKFLSKQYSSLYEIVRSTAMMFVLCIQKVLTHIVPVTLMHTLLIQPFFFFPGPPNLIISLQDIHIPQSLWMHPLHFPHLVLLSTPKSMHVQTSLIPLIKLLSFTFLLLIMCTMFNSSTVLSLLSDRWLINW